MNTTIDALTTVNRYFKDLQNRCALTPKEERVWAKVSKALHEKSPICYPNKVFIANFITDYMLKLEHFIIIAASCKEIAEKYLYDKFSIRPELTWLMDCNYKLIWDRDGEEIAIKQVQILWSSNREL